MERETQVVIIAVFLLGLIGLVNYGLGNLEGDITGSLVVKSLGQGYPRSNEVYTPSVVKVTPETVRPGQNIAIEVIPTKLGIRNYYQLCNEGGNCHLTGEFRCAPSGCKGIITRAGIKTGSDWKPGRYYVRILEFRTNKEIRKYFDIAP